MPRATVSPADIADYSDRMGALILAIRGDFNDEIAALKEQRAGLADDLAALGTKDDVAKMRADADAYVQQAKDAAAQLQAQASDAMAQATAAVKDAADRVAAVTAREQAASQNEARLSGVAANLDAKQAQWQTDMQKVEDVLATREAAVRDREQAVVAAQDQLDADRKAFNDKLAALRA